MLREFWRQVRLLQTPRSAPGRLKQWLGLLTRNYPEAQQLFSQLRRVTDCAAIDQWFGFMPGELGHTEQLLEQPA